MDARELLAEMTAAPFTGRYGIRMAGEICTTPAEPGMEEITFDQFHRTLVHCSGGVFSVTVVELVPDVAGPAEARLAASFMAEDDSRV